MNSETIVYCVVALILGMLLANMLKSVCGCNKVVEGNKVCPPGSAKAGQRYNYGCGPFPTCCDGTLWSLVENAPMPGLIGMQDEQTEMAASLNQGLSAATTGAIVAGEVATVTAASALNEEPSST